MILAVICLLLSLVSLVLVSYAVCKMMHKFTIKRKLSTPERGRTMLLVGVVYTNPIIIRNH